jgi:hypothetical protein
MKKRILALLLALSLALPLTACGGKTETTTEEPPAQEETEAPAEIPAEEPAETPEETPEEPSAEDAVQAPAETPAETKPVQSQPARPSQTPTEQPAVTAPSASVALATIYNAVTGACEWPALMEAEDEVLDAFYPGLTDIQTRQRGVYLAMISAAVGELALVEVESSEDVQKVKDIFQARVDYQVGDDENPGAAWYPETIEGWKNGARIVSNGNFVMLVALSEGTDSAVAAFNAQF